MSFGDDREGIHSPPGALIPTTIDMGGNLFGHEPIGGRKTLALAAVLAFSTSAHAADPALNALGQAGGLVIPYGFALPQGVGEVQYNDFIDPRYGKTATGSQIYWGAVGLFPYVELSGGLANYPANVGAPLAHEEHVVLRHLMADVKLEVPKFFKYQPSIAFGVADIGGQTHFFPFEIRCGVASIRTGDAHCGLWTGRPPRRFVRRRTSLAVEYGIVAARRRRFEDPLCRRALSVSAD
ncbi:protein of unknown function [Paraburkholderia dioscoreae]|uniref:Exopolysaccharide biosynthesis protein YbjH n=1 Tax=Paraburkholderia dioscoreae TaxID=2604047 RepID=A0A5Q4ZJA2_9BURK|nr:protein of unknown function [Paraburkholderia dioscoreae]